MNVTEPDIDPSAEAAHLRRLLDTQPGCLMRLADDGTLLALNKSALALLGLTSVAQALGRDFSTWIPADERLQWTEFLFGVAQGKPASLECHVMPASGGLQPALLHGVPIAQHPDGISSIAVAARGVAAQRQLQSAVLELRHQVERERAARARVEAQLAESEGARRAAETKLNAALTDVQQLEAALESFAARRKQPDGGPARADGTAALDAESAGPGGAHS